MWSNVYFFNYILFLERWCVWVTTYQDFISLKAVITFLFLFLTSEYLSIFPNTIIVFLMGHLNWKVFPNLICRIYTTCNKYQICSVQLFSYCTQQTICGKDPKMQCCSGRSWGRAGIIPPRYGIFPFQLWEYDKYLL